MKLSAILAAFFFSLLSYQPLLRAQATPASSTPGAQQLYPDQGYLSPTCYVNRYFGFAFDLPPDLQLAPLPQPMSRDGRIPILQLDGAAPGHATVSIVAFSLRGKPALDAKAFLRKALDQELYMGVEELHGLSRTTLAGHQFYFYEGRRGTDQHMMLAADLEGYAIVVMLGATNDKAVKELESSFQRLRFVAPAKARDLAGADAEEYEGPAVSAHRLAQLQADPPANHIDAGTVSGHVYENEGLGFRYVLPPGWTLEAEGAVQPAIERSRSRDYEGGWMDAGERELMKVCSRTLVSTWAKRPDGDGQLTYDDFGEVTLSAVSLACFPTMKFPATLADRQAIHDFLEQLRPTHPILRDMRDARAFTSGGNLFVLLHGTVAFQVPDDALSRRLSIALAVTARQGNLLTWFFAAPHDSELKELLQEQIVFDRGLAAKEAGAAGPGGGDSPHASAPVPPVTPAPATTESASATSAASQPETQPTSAGNAPSAPEAQQENTPSPSGSSPPSLLRPGETTAEQQASGQSSPQKH